MSSWRIGTDSARYGPGFLGGEPAGAAAFVDKLTKWIPGDVLALYVGLVTLLSGDEAAAGGGGSGLESTVAVKPVVWILVVMAILTPIVIVLGAVFAKWAGQGVVRARGVALRAILGTIAFLVWSLTVPGSGWYRLDAVANNSVTVTAIAMIVGFLYGFAADPIVRQVEAE